jgi:hypothetical protein
VQEKYDRLGDTRFEFASKDRFGTVARDPMSRMARYLVDYDEAWEIVGDPYIWKYSVYRGAIKIIDVRSEPYLIPGQALNLTPTHILTFDIESTVVIGLTFVLAIYALNRYRV